MTEDQKKLRNEHINRVGRGYYLDKLPQVCCNCGSTSGLEYHHIVPISQGGTNKLTNIAVVCGCCHLAIHNEKEARAYNLTTSRGRPANVDQAAHDEALEKYRHCLIGQKELKNLLQLSANSKITDNSRYKRYLRENNIKQIKNNLDIIRANSTKPINSGDIVGRIIYKDGSVEDIRA